MIRTNKPERTDAISGPLDPAHYLASLLHAAEEKKRISAAQQNHIRRQTEQILKAMAVRYTFGASSSMPAEKAQQLLSSATYAIGLRLKACASPDTALELLLITPLEKLRSEGLEIIEDLRSRAQAQLHIVQSAPITHNRAWLDTVNTGLVLFFKNYDAYYAAHENPGSIDYPLCINVGRVTGIEFIQKYIERLAIESAFCARWPREDIDALLRGHILGWRELLINVFERVLTNTTGRLLCGLDTGSLELRDSNRDFLAHQLTGQPPRRLQSILSVAASRACSGLDDDVQAYVLKAVRVITPVISTALEGGHTERVFVTPLMPHQPAVLFTDGARMSDEKFREVTEAIRECRFVSDKIALVKEYIRSITDLSDMLGAACFSDDEFGLLFATLDSMTLGQLRSLIPATDLHATEHEKAWHAALLKYIKL